MTPDQDLSARLARLRGGEHEAEAEGDYDTADLDQACGDAYRSGQLITLADHEHAVQAAVAQAVEAERAECAKRIDNEVKVARMRGPQHVPVLTALAAAIRSRGVAG